MRHYLLLALVLIYASACSAAYDDIAQKVDAIRILKPESVDSTLIDPVDTFEFNRGEFTTLWADSYENLPSSTTDLWKTITSDSGSTSANSPTDTLTITGSGGLTTSVSGDTLTIDGSGIPAGLWSSTLGWAHISAPIMLNRIPTIPTGATLDISPRPGTITDTDIDIRGGSAKYGATILFNAGDGSGPMGNLACHQDYLLMQSLTGPMLLTAAAGNCEITARDEMILTAEDGVHIEAMQAATTPQLILPGASTASSSGTIRFIRGDTAAALGSIACTSNCMWITSARPELQMGVSTGQYFKIASGVGRMNMPLQLGTGSPSSDGYIRYTGSDFEGRHGGSWLSLTSGIAGLNLAAKSPGAVTIVGDAITVSSASDFYFLNPESGVADTLQTINGGTSGDIIVIMPNAIGDIINVVETGNIYAPGGAAILTMNNVDAMILAYRADMARWVAISWSDNM